MSKKIMWFLFIIVIASLAYADDYAFTITRIKYSNGTSYSGTNQTTITLWDSYTSGSSVFNYTYTIPYNNGTASIYLYNLSSLNYSSPYTYLSLWIENLEFTPRFNITTFKRYNTTSEIKAVQPANTSAEIWYTIQNNTWQYKTFNNCSGTDKAIAFEGNGTIICSSDLQGGNSTSDILNIVTPRFVNSSKINNGTIYQKIYSWNEINNTFIYTNDLTNSTSDIRNAQLFNTSIEMWVVIDNSTFIRKTGDTMVGALNIGTGGFGSGGITLETDGDIWIAGGLYIEGNITNVNVDNITVNGSFTPSLNNIFDLGTNTRLWNKIFATTLHGSLGFGNLTGIPTDCSSNQYAYGITATSLSCRSDLFNSTSDIRNAQIYGINVSNTAWITTNQRYGLNTTGTLTDTKWCLWDSVSSEIDCNTEPVSDTANSTTDILNIITPRFVNLSLWTSLDNYPTDCSAGNYVYGLGDALSCRADLSNSTTDIRSVFRNSTNITYDASTGSFYYNGTMGGGSNTTSDILAVTVPVFVNRSQPNNCTSSQTYYTWNAVNNTFVCKADLINTTSDIQNAQIYGVNVTSTTWLWATQQYGINTTNTDWVKTNQNYWNNTNIVSSRLTSTNLDNNISLGCGNITGSTSNLCTLTSGGNTTNEIGIAMDNNTIIRRYNQSWITLNQLYGINVTNTGWITTNQYQNCSILNSCVQVVYSNNQTFVRNNQLFNTTLEIRAAQTINSTSDVLGVVNSRYVNKSQINNGTMSQKPYLWNVINNTFVYGIDLVNTTTEINNAMINLTIVRSGNSTFVKNNQNYWNNTVIIASALNSTSTITANNNIIQYNGTKHCFDGPSCNFYIMVNTTTNSFQMKIT